MPDFNPAGNFKRKKGGREMRLKKGFTLVELLVALAIITILSAVVLPALHCPLFTVPGTRPGRRKP